MSGRAASAASVEIDPKRTLGARFRTIQDRPKDLPTSLR
jgi:hypothetical protein